jgi:MOSC domain-containing protein YiiM
LGRSRGDIPVPAMSGSSHAPIGKSKMDNPGSMTLVSVNCGLPRDVVWRGRTVTTSIYKEPVSGRVALRTRNLDGDRQADLSVHGGVSKAVYCYPSVHYEYWKKELPGRELPLGSFGENFTVAGLVEDSVHIGDRFTVGSAEVVVTEPRLPCYKLGVKFQSDQMVKRFLTSGRSGFYVAVLREGDVGAGDKIVMTKREPQSVPLPWITRLHFAKNYSREDIMEVQQVLMAPGVPDSWKEYFRERLSRAGA